MLKLRLQHFGHLMWRPDSLEKTLMLGKVEGRRRRGWQRMRCWMASPTQWTWVRVNSGSWWWTVRPGVLQSLRTSLRVQLLIICPARQGCVFFAMQGVQVRSLVRELRSHTLISSVQSLSQVWLFVTPWTAACQASLSITNSWSPPKTMSIESVMPSNHPILCRPLLLLPSIFPIIRVFSNESAWSQTCDSRTVT